VDATSLDSLRGVFRSKPSGMRSNVSFHVTGPNGIGEGGAAGFGGLAGFTGFFATGREVTVTVGLAARCVGVFAC
jgi:hypothetical protein